MDVEEDSDQHFTSVPLKTSAWDLKGGFCTRAISTIISCAGPNDYMYIISFLANGDFCCMMITLANSLNPDQNRRNIDPDKDPNRLTL